MATFASNDVVLARSGDLWLPAVVQREPGLDGEVEVKFVGTGRGRAKSATVHAGRDMVAFAASPLLKFKDSKVDNAYKRAMSMGEVVKSPVVKVFQLEEEDKKEGGMLDEGGDGKWKDDFISSLEDSDNEDDDKENGKDESWSPGPKFVTSKKRVPLQELVTGKMKKPKTGKRESAPAAIKVVNEKMSDYEKIRQKNIEDRKAMFAALKMEFNSFKASLAPAKRPSTGGGGARRHHRKYMPYLTKRDPVYTRSRRNSSGDSCSSNSNASSEFSTPRKWSEEDEYSSGDEGYMPARERRSAPRMWCFNPNDDILMPEDITDEMMDNVADRVLEKIYSQNGTTCHQCRQKTLDTKTVCRSGHCAGIRGKFCGVCLPNRYGQDVREALKDPNWTCPVCLDFCNCSICRNRIGKGATGPITYLAQAKGFKSVKDYLDSLTKRKGTDEYDDEDEENKEN